MKKLRLILLQGFFERVFQQAGCPDLKNTACLLIG